MCPAAGKQAWSAVGLSEGGRRGRKLGMIRTSKEDREGFIQALRQIKLRVIRVLNNTKPRSVGDGHLVALPQVPIIKVWYGDNQVFGHNGIPQTWVNILGNASARSGIARIVYSLNGGPKQQLWIGKSRTRLVDPGDFNAEIAYSSLLPGANEVCLTATARDGHTSQRTVTLNYVADKTCPFSYCIDWSKVSNIQDVVQVIDGHWALRDGGVRTVQIGYDRLFGFGEANTWTNLLGMVEITIHAVDPTGFAVGPIVGWTGHTAEDNGLVWLDQPRTGHPFPADFVYTEHGLIIGSTPPRLRNPRWLRKTSKSVWAKSTFSSSTYSQIHGAEVTSASKSGRSPGSNRSDGSYRPMAYSAAALF